MAERKHISLIYQYDDKWIGGTYYILNIIRALNVLADELKPFLTIYYNAGSSLSDLKSIGYEYIEYIEFTAESSMLVKVVNKAWYTLTGQNLILKRVPAKSVDNFYFRTFNISSANIKRYYHWIADLQDLYLPHFFSPNELKKRLDNYARLVKERQPIVFSSNAALNDFNKFYPDNKNVKEVLPFVSSTNDDFKSLSLEHLKQKFHISSEYFILSNQFWKHKNHITVLKAFKLFCESNSGYSLLLTGKEYDYRDPEYTNDLKSFVTEHNLEDKVKFLGFIERSEQLKLMSHSVAVIQPSLFEGWSTVIEDAKYLNKIVICSDIPVHKEQLPLSDLFFEPLNEKQLLQKMQLVLQPAYKYQNEFNHTNAMTTFGLHFIKLFN